MAPLLKVEFVRRRPHGSFLGWTLLVAGVVGLLASAWDYGQAREDLRLAKDRAERYSRTVDELRRSTAAVLPKTAISSHARVVKATGLPWGKLLKELEGLAEPGVALLAIEAQGATRKLRITGEAKTMAEVIAYVESLRLSMIANSVALGSHETVLQEGVSVIRFVVEVDWGRAP